MFFGKTRRGSRVPLAVSDKVRLHVLYEHNVIDMLLHSCDGIFVRSAHHDRHMLKSPSVYIYLGHLVVTYFNCNSREILRSQPISCMLSVRMIHDTVWENDATKI